MKITGGTFKEFSSGDECRQSARAVRDRLNSFGPQEPEPAPLVPESEAALASSIALEPRTTAKLLTIHSIVLAIAAKLNLSFEDAMTGADVPAATARKVGAALAVRRLDLTAEYVASLFEIPRDAVLDGLLLIDPVLRERAVPRSAPLPDVLTLLFDARRLYDDARKISVEEVKRAVCVVAGVHMSDLISQRRDRTIVRPRQIAMSLARHLTGKSLPELGRRFGGRDHTTVLHACKRYRALVDQIAPLIPAEASAGDWVRALYAALPGFTPFNPKRYDGPGRYSPPKSAAA